MVDNLNDIKNSNNNELEYEKTDLKSDVNNLGDYKVCNIPIKFYGNFRTNQKEFLNS